MKLYHAADIHLGRRRLDGALPDLDLADAFRHIANAAVADSADVFLLAGDLFDRPQVEPGHLRQAQEILQILYRAKIPVVAIEGNHDKAAIHSEHATWVGFLAGDGLVQLLRPRFGPEGALLELYDPARCQGSVIEFQGVRFIGAGYLGAATPAKVRQVTDALDVARANVLLLHAGPDYFVGEGGGFSKDDLSAVRQKVSYLALGHIHKPMIHDGWACNPGSPENCDLREAHYDFAKNGQPAPRGYAVVQIDPAKRDRPDRLEIRSNPRRPVLHARLDCTPFGKKLKGGAAAFHQAAAEAVRSLSPAPDSAIHLQLTGTMNLNRIALDHVQAAAQICQEAGVFAVSIDATQLNLDSSDGAGFEPAAAVSRQELEIQALRKIAGGEPLCAENPDAFASLFFDLKEAVRAGKEAQVIAELISTSPLVEVVQSAKETQAAAVPVAPAALPETKAGI